MSSAAVAIQPEPVEFWEAEEERLQPARPLRAVPSPAPQPSAQSGAAADLDAEDVAARFAVLADQLEAESTIVSNTRRLVRQPAFIDILALGNDAIPLLLHRLETSDAQPVWLRLLGSLTSFQPGAGQETIEAAAAEWLRWGRREAYVTRLRPLG